MSLEQRACQVYGSQRRGRRASITGAVKERIFESDPQVALALVLPVVQMMGVLHAVVIQRSVQAVIRPDVSIADHAQRDDGLSEIFFDSLFRSGNISKLL